MLTDKTTFGELVQHYRRRIGLTQEQLAERARLSARALSDLERGIKTHPRASTVRRLADGLELTPEERARLEEASRPVLHDGTLPDRVAPSLPAGKFSGARRSLPVLQTILALIILVLAGAVFLGSRLFGPAAGISGSLHGPVGLASDAHGNVFVSDQGNNRVVEFNPSGIAIHSWGTTGAGSLQFNSPGALALGPNEALYIVDTANKRIQVLRGGRQVDEYMQNAGALALDSAGRLFATDYGQKQIRVFMPDGRIAGTLPIPEVHVGAHPFPAGIAVDPQGNLYVTDRENDRIVKLSPSGAVTATFGHYGTGDPEPGSGTPQFDMPSDVTVDRWGRIYVADTRNDRIQILSPVGKVLNIVPRIGSHQVRLYQPVSLAVDGQGNLYVADYYDNRVEKLSREGTLLWTTPDS